MSNLGAVVLSGPGDGDRWRTLGRRPAERRSGSRGRRTGQERHARRDKAALGVCAPATHALAATAGVRPGERVRRDGPSGCARRAAVELLPLDTCEPRRPLPLLRRHGHRRGDARLMPRQTEVDRDGAAMRYGGSGGAASRVAAAVDELSAASASPACGPGNVRPPLLAASWICSLALICVAEEREIESGLVWGWGEGRSTSGSGKRERASGSGEPRVGGAGCKARAERSDEV